MTKSLQLAQGMGLEFVEQNGEILFTAKEIGKHLGYADPRKAIHKIFDRNRKELEPYLGVVNLGTPQGNQDTTVCSEEGVYIITMLARTEKAREFRAKVAKLLKRFRQHQLDAAIILGRRESFKAHNEQTPFMKENLGEVVRYSKMGLKNHEAAKLLDCSVNTIIRSKRVARHMGMEV